MLVRTPRTSVDALSGLKVGTQKGTIQSNLIARTDRLFELDKFPAQPSKCKTLPIWWPDASVARARFLWQTGLTSFTFTSEAGGQGSYRRAAGLSRGRYKSRGRLCFR